MEKRCVAVPRVSCVLLLLTRRVYIRRYEKLVKEAETTRNANVQKRKEELSSMLQRNERLLNVCSPPPGQLFPLRCDPHLP